MRGQRIRSMGNIVGRTKKIIRKLQRSARWLHWDLIDAGDPGEFSDEVHLLIAKNPIYAKIGLTCVLSFLHFHPNARITLHCDSSTLNAVQNLVSHRKRKKNISILEDLDADATWQYSKLKLILSLSGSNAIFMDADLRWNGRLIPPKSLTFFAAEFPLFQKSPFRQIINQLKPAADNQILMKNTSFFCFAGILLRDSIKNQVLELYDKFEEIILNSDVGELDIEQLLRLSEQIILSTLSEEWSTNVEYLKLVDGHKDGAFVESSYFGATGAMF
jgi:hypothetical protein